jgi:hypothetical protein
MTSKVLFLRSRASFLFVRLRWDTLERHFNEVLGALLLGIYCLCSLILIVAISGVLVLGNTMGLPKPGELPQSVLPLRSTKTKLLALTSLCPDHPDRRITEELPIFPAVPSIHVHMLKSSFPPTL